MSKFDFCWVSLTSGLISDVAEIHSVLNCHLYDASELRQVVMVAQSSKGLTIVFCCCFLDTIS